MSEQDWDEGRDATSGQSVRADAEARLVLTTSQRLRSGLIPAQRLGGYSRGDVDSLLGRAAQTVDNLLGEVVASQDQIAALQARQVALEGRLEQAERRSPEEIVGEVLITAHRAAESVIEKAKRDAAEVDAEARRGALALLAEARGTLEEAGRFHRDAQIAVERGHAQAKALLESARAEHERLVAELDADAESTRNTYDVEKRKLESALFELRAEWAALATDALARLDAIAIEVGLPTEGGGVAVEPPVDPSVDSPATAGGDVVDDLQSRLAESRDGADFGT